MALCALRRKMAQAGCPRGREMARVRNQISPVSAGQQAVLNEKHQQRNEQLRDVAMAKGSSLKLLVVTLTLVTTLFPCHRHHPCLPHDEGFF